MAVTAKQNDSLEPMQVHMKGALVSSGILHGIIMLIVVAGLPFITPELPPIEEAITVEIADIDEITQTDRTPEIIKNKKPEKKPTENKQPEQKDKPKAAPRVTAKKPPSPAAPVEPDLAVPEQTQVTKKAPAPVKKPKPVKKEEQNEEEFNSVLKNLLPDEGQPEEEAPQAPVADKLTVTERRLLAARVERQLSSCWNLMAGARYAEDLVVEMRLYMARDGMVKRAEVMDQLRYNTDSFYRAAADSALRAVKSPSCMPFDLTSDKFEYWKIINTTFDPREMLL